MLHFAGAGCALASQGLGVDAFDPSIGSDEEGVGVVFFGVCGVCKAFLIQRFAQEHSESNAVQKHNGLLNHLRAAIDPFQMV
jgi:hypothetical protein